MVLTHVWLSPATEVENALIGVNPETGEMAQGEPAQLLFIFSNEINVHSEVSSSWNAETEMKGSLSKHLQNV